ncbi:proline dehydrogenase 2, mitochondrial-like [Benincasa hispida]|uniref:proline dehydrogenase 2, mitochondrial-like n=1 Tax=Benincasa hispida TaxID=102211 RepID=UPI0019014219|nr:proline dehydrogenase 2, mitochondrial-like [Benincasa hispida]
MARTIVSTQSKIPKKVFFYVFNRSLNTAASSSAAAFTAAATSPPLPLNLNSPTTPTVDFTDTRALFGSLPTSDLLHAATTLHAAAIGPVVDVGMWVMNSKLMDVELVRDLVLGTVKHTFYRQFCAGEDDATVAKTVRRLHDVGLRSMLDYALEYADDEASCDRNLDGFLRTIEITKSLPPGSASFVVTKVSAICPLRLLERVSDLLRWQQKNPSFNLPWKLKTLPIFSESSPLYHTLEQPKPLTHEEEKSLQMSHERLMKICQSCVDANVPLAIDAEHTKVQPAIDYFTYSAAIIHNKDHIPIVYGTIQAYLKDAKDRLLLVNKEASKLKVPLGIKLVRGAYMSSESKIASSLGFESPIHNTIQDTHVCYNTCASFLLDNIAKGSSGVILATHNVESGKLAATKAYEIGMGKLKQKLEFAQLYGMSEALSFGLRNAGFQVSKYMPFGPVDMVMPYLLRRAEENRGLLSTSNLDRQLMRKELGRRMKECLR